MKPAAVIASVFLIGCAQKPAEQARLDPMPGPPEPTVSVEPARAGHPEAPSPAPAEARPAHAGLREVFPHVRLDVAGRMVEFDGYVPFTTHDPLTPVVYLETIVCTPETRPHESLVATLALPSHVHAALLALGLTPGRPGEVVVEDGNLLRRPPEGPPLSVLIVTRDAEGRDVEHAPEAWIVNAATGERLGERGPAPAWVFAGSRFVEWKGREFYDADGSGVLVGLHTFGAETVAFVSVMSPDAAVEEPEWIADAAAVPPMGTPVVVRLRARP